MAVAGNALAGAGALAAWRRPALRGRWVWVLTGVAEAALLLQVVTGVALVAAQHYSAPDFHMFYGFVGFVTVAIAYSSRDAMRGRLELFYGLVGLFLMGLGIRAWVEMS